MKINGKGNANFPEDNFQRKKLVKGTAKEEAKHTDANSADALASIGRAFVNMSFKGKSVPSSNIKELSDVEFEEYKKELSEKIKSLPEQIQTKAEKWFQYLRGLIIMLN